MTIRVLLVDDHQIMREGLKAILAEEPMIDVVGEADDGRQAVELAASLSPDIVVMDVGMPSMNGIEATRKIRARHPGVGVIALSMYSDKRYVDNMLDAGAGGYVLKESAGEDLLRAVQAVATGKGYLSPEITDLVVDGYMGKQASGASSVYELLGNREREVLQLLAEGRTSRDIGAQLSIAVKTVETHRRNIKEKLNMRSVAELTKYAVREGLTPLE